MIMINHSRLIKILLILIVILGFALRFYKLGLVPPSLNWDEVALGYNAYSLGIDGRDEFGKFLPYTALESFGDYKPPVYSILDVIPVKIFGLNEFAVRFPSALFGSIAIFLTFFLVKQIFVKKENIERNRIEKIALISSLLLAISPWHIMLSRAAFEANIASFLIIAGALLFFLGINSKKYYLILSSIFFAITFYTFNSARVFVPILIVGFGLFFYKKLVASKKELAIAMLVGIFMLAPLVPFLFSPQASTRFKEVNIFSDPQIVLNSNYNIERNGGTLLAKAIYNRRIGYASSFLKHYLDNLSPQFLFIKGDGNPRFSVQKVGQMLIWEAPFLLIGLLFLIKKRESYWYIVPFWLLTGIIPAAFARETPHALRIESTLPMFQIIVAYGVVSFLEVFKFKKRRMIETVLGLLLIVNLLYFLRVLFLYYPSVYASDWQFGYKESVRFAAQNKNNYNKIYFTENLGRPYINYLFYNKISPQRFRESSIIERDVFGFVTVKKTDDNIFFEKNLGEIYIKEPENLYIDYFNSKKDFEAKIPQGISIVNKVLLPDGNGLFVAYTNKN